MNKANKLEKTTDQWELVSEHIHDSDPKVVAKQERETVLGIEEVKPAKVEIEKVNALSIACEIFDKQGYVKQDDVIQELQDKSKDVPLGSGVKLSKKANKTILLDQLGTQYTTDRHESIDGIEEMVSYLTFKKLSGDITEYENLVSQILEKDTIHLRDIGVVASVPLMYSNYQKNEQRKNAYQYHQEHSKHQGMVGEKFYGAVKLMQKYHHVGKDFYIYTFVLDNKHILKWLTGKNFEEFNKGAKIKLSGVVKAHSTTNYYGNETVLTRCNLMRDI